MDGFRWDLGFGVEFSFKALFDKLRVCLADLCCKSMFDGINPFIIACWKGLSDESIENREKLGNRCFSSRTMK